MTRPSARDATISSFVTRTSRIRGSAAAAVVIPRLHDLLVVLPNGGSGSARVLQPMVPRENQRVQPELAGTPLSFYVDVRRFVAIEAGEEESIWSGDATDAWHSGAPAHPSRSHSDISWPAVNDGVISCACSDPHTDTGYRCAPASSPVS